MSRVNFDQRPVRPRFEPAGHDAPQLRDARIRPARPDTFEDSPRAPDRAVQRPEEQPPPPKPKKKGFFGRLWSGVKNGFIRGVSGVVGGVAQLFGQKIGPHSPLPKNMKTFGELSPGQQQLLGPQGQAAWDRLAPRNKAAFIVLTTQMDRLGVDYSGMQLKGGAAGVHVDRLMLEQRPGDATGQQRFQASIQAGIGSGKFEQDKVDGDLHPGMDQFGVRQNVERESMQIGIGPEGAFVDIDRYNPRKNALAHLGEVFMPGETDLGQVAKALGIELASSSKPSLV